MAKITSKNDLNVGTELIIDEPNRTWQLAEAGNLNFKDGVTFQAVYSKFVDLYTTPTYQDSPFPMYAIDVLSGQFQFGTDGASFSGWAPLDQATINALRDGGFDQFDASGNLLTVYAGFNGLGTINSGAQPYYIIDAADAPTDFPFDDQFNVPIQVFGDAANGNFDKRVFAKAFVREQGKKYSDSVLADTGKTGTGAFKVDFLINNEDDLKITDTDVNVAANAPYTGITVEYFATDQLKDVGGTNYPFRVIVEGNNATLEQIYTKLQYLLRQSTDIDSGAGTVIGKTADLLAEFVGDTLETTQGVFIENINPNDINRVVLKDQNGIDRTFPFVSAGNLTFNSFLIGAGSSYRLMFKNPPGAGNDYGEAGAVTVEDDTNTAITGVVTAAQIPFTYDHAGNTQAGYVGGEDRDVILIAINPGTGKFASGEGTLTASKGLVISAVAEQDRAYSAA